ncbi:O-methyltransferase [Pterulicium gracile]|uniref:O-methyltransferase n=1 Tax=Pterulicium gracile TaxID=1884261 RepID=A0A5C3QI47_9AGAR|nr:O-methyltransferase [Pterula gracilis]
MSSLVPLLEIITTGVADLKSAEKKNNTLVPDLSAPFHPASEAFRADPVAAESAAKIVAAATQLVATLSPPVEGLYALAAAGAFKAAALRVCHESNVTEILREAGPEGLHAKEIAQKNGLEEKKIARFLRLLASNHIYEEVRPDVFRNNRLSSLLDSGKSSADVIANPKTKHDNTKGPGVFLSHHLDEVSHSAAYTWENVSNPKIGHSYEANQCPLSTYLGREVSFWEHMAEPGQEFRRKRFDLAMKGVQAMQPTTAVLDSLDWDKLPKGSTIVDVGGGIGSYMVPLVENFPDLKYVVQDLPESIENAEAFWGEKDPKAIADQTVSLEAHSFFEPQPERDVGVFFMKSIIHDWSDANCKKILTHLRKAAGKDTKLVLAESIIPYACRMPEEAEADSKDCVPGSILKQAPAPLLPNSLTAPMVLLADIVMLIGLSGQERTFDHMQELLLGAGWKVDEVRRPGAARVMYSFYIASPI